MQTGRCRARRPRDFYRHFDHITQAVNYVILQISLNKLNMAAKRPYHIIGPTTLTYPALNWQLVFSIAVGIGGYEVFTIYSDTDAGSTLVSNLFIDEYMKDANDAQIKIYLYLLRMMGAGRATSISDMADQFNHTEKEVLRSLRYWESKGLISLQYSSLGDLVGIRLTRLCAARPAMEILPQTLPAPPSRSAASQEQTPFSAASSLSAMAVPGHSGGHFDPLQSPQVQAPASDSRYQQYQDFSVPARTAPDKASLEAFRGSEKRAQLLFVIEQYIGKPLSPSEVQSVYYISEDLHFSDALIDYLLQYCIDRGKKDFRYIEKVAVNWAEHGITTPKQAEQAVSPVSRKRGSGTAPSANPFNRFEQNKYDFDQLEKEILSN